MIAPTVRPCSSSAEIFFSVPLTELCPNDCSGNGVCENGTCKCNQNFDGSDCSFGESKSQQISETYSYLQLLVLMLALTMVFAITIVVIVLLDGVVMIVVKVRPLFSDIPVSTS